MKVLLIEPCYSYRSLGFMEASRNEPLALESVAASISNRHDIELLDMRIDSDLEGIITTFQPDVVALTAYTTQVYIAREILRKVKEINPTIMTVVGGIHATLCPQDFYNEFIDIIVLGEGEYSFREIIESGERGTRLAEVKGIIYKENGRFVRTNRRPLIENLDELPFPDRRIIKRYKGKYVLFPWGDFASVYTSRGCTSNCKFCSVWIVNKKQYRAKSAGRVFEELNQIEENNIMFSDDNFFADAIRCQELYHLIKEKGNKYSFIMVQSGVETILGHPSLIESWRDLSDYFMILVGFESFENEQIDSLHKNVSAQQNKECIEILKQNDVAVFAAFIIDPQYNECDFERLNEHLERARINYGQYTVLTPLPGTPFYKARERELVIRNYELFDCMHSVLPTQLPRQDFYRLFAQLYRNLTKSSRTQTAERRRLDKFLVSHEISSRDIYEEWATFRHMIKKITNPQVFLSTEEGFVLEKPT
ncbi:MAG: cobalamin-dependent protein [Desulfobacterales bacterium]|nr:MAG: cobalamin-dependent protein [Desulfobacterales bacterium]